MDLVERDEFWQTLFSDETPLVSDDHVASTSEIDLLSSPESCGEPSQVPNSPLSSPMLATPSSSRGLYIKPEPFTDDDGDNDNDNDHDDKAAVATSTKAKPKRTRRSAAAYKKEEAQDSGVASVTLSRNQMLHFSAQEYEDFIAAIMAQRPLSAQEEEVVRKQRRLVRNRESAQASRTRKRQRIEELEDQVRAITREKEAVVSELNQAKGANDALQRTTEYLQDLVSRTPLLTSLAAAQGPSLSEHNPDTPNDTSLSSTSMTADNDNDDDDDDAAASLDAYADSMQLVAVKKEKLTRASEHHHSSGASDSPRRSPQNMGVMMLLVVLACGLFLNAHQPGTMESAPSMPRLAPLLLQNGVPHHLDDDASWSSPSPTTTTTTAASTTTALLHLQEHEAERCPSASVLGKRSHAEMSSTDQAQAHNSTTTSTSSPTEPHTTTTTTTTATATRTGLMPVLVPRRPANLVPTLVEQPLELQPSFNANGNVLQATIDAAMRQQAAQVGAPLIALLIPPHMLSAALFNASQAGYQLLLPRDLPRAQGF